MDSSCVYAYVPTYVPTYVRALAYVHFTLTLAMCVLYCTVQYCTVHISESSGPKGVKLNIHATMGKGWMRWVKNGVRRSDTFWI